MKNNTEESIDDDFDNVVNFLPTETESGQEIHIL